MRLQVTRGGVPAGQYDCKFEGVTPNVTKYGPGLQWRFRVIAGEYAGEEITAVTAQAPTEKNSCGRLLSGLVGQQLAFSDNVDTDKYVGRLYSVVTEPTESGGSKVVGVMAAAPAPSTPPPSGGRMF